MTGHFAELTVSEARDKFSDAINRAAFAGEVTYVTRGRNRSRAAAIVPIGLVEEYIELVDEQDARIADERLREIAEGEVEPVPAEEVLRSLNG